MEINRMVTIINNMVLHIWKIFSLWKKFCIFTWWQMIIRHGGDHFSMYTNIKSLCCTPVTNRLLYVNVYLNFKKRWKKDKKMLVILHTRFAVPFINSQVICGGYILFNIHWKDWCWSWNSILWPSDVKCQLIGHQFEQNIIDSMDMSEQTPEDSVTRKPGMLHSLGSQSRTWLSGWTTIYYVRHTYYI